MPGAGTDKTKRWIAEPGPVVILVEPQLGDNIGATARAMANFGLSRLRLVKPRDGWPNPRAWVAASGADRVLDQAELFETVEAAVADLTYLFATTARAHDQAKPVMSPEEAARIAAPRVGSGEDVGVLFGRERYGLENDEVALADAIVTLPVNPAFASLNLAQAVLVVGYEWFKLTSGGKLPFARREKSEAAPREQLFHFFETLERELERVDYFRPPDKRGTMQINLRNIVHRMQATKQDVQTLQGVVTALAHGRKGPASGGMLDGAQADLLRTLVERDKATSGDGGVARGLAKFLRRNPTEAERKLWDALTKDRRFAGRGFKRQTPVGRHVADFVSFPLRIVVDLVRDDEPAEAAQTRSERCDWLAARGYHVVAVRWRELNEDVAAVLDRVDAEVTARAAAGS